MKFLELLNLVVELENPQKKQRFEFTLYL